MSERVAKIIRIVTAPPVLITITLLLFWRFDSDVYTNVSQLANAVVSLGLIPALAYPLQALIPSLKAKGRDGQRRLAFIMSLVGYAIGMVTVFLGAATEALALIYVSYFISVVLLTIVNKLFYEKASGHACSAFGSLSFATLHFGWIAVVPCVVLFAAMAWSSVKLGRHSLRNIISGSVVFLVSLLAAATILLCWPVA